jgi:ribosomal protein L37E
MNIRYCSRCVFPETKPDLFFNEQNVCSACMAAEQKDREIDWAQREKTSSRLSHTTEKARRNRL